MNIFFYISLEGFLATNRSHMEAHAGFFFFGACKLHMVIDYHSKSMPLKFGDDWLYKLRGIANPSLLCVEKKFDKLEIQHFHFKC